MAEVGWGSTADAVLDGLDLAGRRVLVTAVSAGLGVETARALAARGAAVVHPGGIQTELGRYLTPEARAALECSLDAARKPGEAAFRYKTVSQGAATSVGAGVRADADAIGGRYCEGCHVAAVQADQTKRTGVRPYALDPERAEALWAGSEELVGERF